MLVLAVDFDNLALNINTSKFCEGTNFGDLLYIGHWICFFFQQHGIAQGYEKKKTETRSENSEMNSSFQMQLFPWFDQFCCSNF
jgi:hypothetical protein